MKEAKAEPFFDQFDATKLPLFRTQQEKGEVYGFLFTKPT